MPRHEMPRSFVPLAVLLGCLLVVIAAVSVHDAMLLALNIQVIHEAEQNPLGRWLIVQGNGEVGLFVALKLAGTTTSCTAILAMFRDWPRRSVFVASAIASAQLGLLAYLSL